MKRQADTEQWPIFLDKISWVAGVLDAAGVFQVRVRDGEPFAAAIRVREKEVAGALKSAIGGAIAADGRWFCPAMEQLALLEKVMPYLRIKIDSASEIYRFRLLSPRRAIGWELTPAVREFRRRLLTRAGGGGTLGGRAEGGPEGGSQ